MRHAKLFMFVPTIIEMNKHDQSIFLKCGNCGEECFYVESAKHFCICRIFNAFFGDQNTLEFWASLI